MQRYRPESLDTLPSELLLDILDYCGKQTTIPRRYRIAFTLSQVNRRLRTFYFTGRGKELARHVRNIRIGRMDISICDEWFPYFGLDTYPFSNLLSFTCLQGMCGHRELVPLRVSTRLSSLCLSWRDTYTFPKIHHWPELKTLRLYICSGVPYQRPVIRAPRYETYNSLTTLVVNDHGWSHWWHGHIGMVTFPRLRVLNLQEAMSPPHDVYHFIHRHPTLREVNVSFFESCTLSFEGLLKLIEGTGTWKPLLPQINLNDVTEEAFNVPKPNVDDPVFSFDTDPGIIPQTCITFDAFAFARAPLSPEMTQWNELSGSPQPCYAITALALPIYDQCEYEAEGFEVTTLLDLFDFAERFPAMEELRIASETTQLEGNFTMFMTDIGKRLRGWKRLRKLAFSFAIPRSYEWGWGTCADRPGLHLTVLDATLPPVQLSDVDWPKSENGTALCLNEFRSLGTENLFRKVRDGLYEVLGPDTDLDARADDRHLLMEAWETRHAPCVASMMRYLATCCPTLEEIEWHPIGPFEVGNVVRWVWKVHRLRDGSVKIVTGDLTFVGCTKGDPPSLEILVGQELEFCLSQRSERY
ncbi:hypothetical protein AcV7_000971 [Taiwanofungus camphoratus]|nr:hypothetical protein AcV7_000971 [Antrodia cinnamomea]